MIEHQEKREEEEEKEEEEEEGLLRLTIWEETNVSTHKNSEKNILY